MPIAPTGTVALAARLPLLPVWDRNNTRNRPSGRSGAALGRRWGGLCHCRRAAILLADALGGAGDIAEAWAAGTLARVPGVRLVWVRLTGESPHPGDASGRQGGWGQPQVRVTCRVRVAVPRLLPVRYPSVAEGSCALPMEPVW